MRKLFTSIIVLGCLLPLSAQGEDDIQQIRKRFYRTNGDNISLQKREIAGRAYFFEGEVLRKVIERRGDTLLEYYYDQSYLSGYAYFIFEQIGQGSGLQENRYYYGEGKALIRWLGPGLVNRSEESAAFCVAERQYAAQAQDIFILLENARQDEAHPQHALWVEQIDREISRLNASGLRADTLEDVFIEEESYYRTVVKYYDTHELLRKSYALEGGDHGGQSETDYYDPQGQKIASVEERGSIYEGNTTVRTYHRSGETPFRRVEVNETYTHFAEPVPCQGFRYVHVGKVSDL